MIRRRKQYLYENNSGPVPKTTRWRRKKRNELSTYNEDVSVEDSADRSSIHEEELNIHGDPNIVNTSQNAMSSSNSSSEEDLAAESDDSEEEITEDTDGEVSVHSPVNGRRSPPLPQQNQQPALDNPLNESTPTTEGDAMLMCLALGLRHSLSWAAIIDILTMVNRLFDRDAVKATKYFFLKYMEVGKENTIYHLYCPSCERYLGCKQGTRHRLECPCGWFVEDVSQAKSFFLSLGLSSQIKDLFSDLKFVEALSHRFERVKHDENAIEDIYDGAVYQRMSMPGQVLWERHNISYTFNTDGVPIGKSSRQSMWPIYVTINELPHQMRSKYMLLAGIYVGRKEPNMKIFLHPFVEEANLLSTVGVNWVLDGNEVNSKVVPICASVDSVARCQMLNMSQFNAYNGCTVCYQKAERTVSGLRYLLPRGPIEYRTHDSILMDATRAFANRNNPDRKMRVVRGVKGPSPLHNLHYFNLADGMVPDYMHSVLLGNIKHHTDILMKSFGKDYYIGSEHKISAINNRLLCIRPPSLITRTPRTIKEMSLWRASEWRSWLLFYSVVCLHGILPDEYLSHLSMLSTAINILVQKSVSLQNLEKAHMLLLRYVFLYQKNFGEAAMVYNVHLLLHLKNGVKNWGPLWTHNAFAFEGQNRHLLQNQKSPASVAQEVARKYLTFRALPALCEKFASSEAPIEFCEAISGRSLKFLLRSGEDVLVGRGALHALSVAEYRALNECGCKNIVDIEVFQRMIHHGIRFTSSSYSRPVKTNDSYIFLKEGTQCRIDRILSVQHGRGRSVYLLVKELIISPDPICRDEFGAQSHLRKFVDEGNLKAIKSTDIAGQSIAMFLNHGNFICNVPYGCYGD